MPVGLGPRFLIEAGFLIAVAIVAGIARFETLTIVLVMAGAWFLVAVAEWVAARVRRARLAEPVAAVPVAQPPPPAEPGGGQPQPQVVSITSRVGPREWNLWDLERIARDTAGNDVARDEERSYILMYLRDFADADGILPADFDGVVRESFGDVLDGV